MDIGASAGLRDCEYYKTVYDKMLLSNDFNDIRAYIIELSFPPPIMCSAGTFPEQDFEGNVLQDLTNLKVIPHLLNFTSFYGGDYGAIVFSWLPECDSTCMSFINSLRSISSDKMTNSLIRFFFEFCENLHIQPEWWESLETEVRSTLIDKMAAAARPDLKRKAACLVDDGIVFDNWQISDLRAINF